MTKSLAWLVLPAVLLGALFGMPARAQDGFTGERFPYQAFDRLPSTPLTVGGGTLKIAFAPGELALSRSAIMAWLQRSAKTVTVYFGKFPVSSVRVLIVPTSGRGAQGSQAFGFRGAAIRLELGRDTSEANLDHDWVAVHEITHLALPDVREPHLWLAEGLATYIEPIARVQAGQLGAEKIWGDMIRDMPKGLPEPGDHGLDRTPTWGRTYWGGAMFCLEADVEIRKRTGNAMGLQQAMRGVVDAGGTIEQGWPIEHIFKVSDQATGTTVLTDLYREMAGQPYAPDLDALWRQLGVSVRDGRVVFDDSAPLAAIRQAITAPPSDSRAKQPS